MLTGDGGIPGVQMRRVDAIGSRGRAGRRRRPATHADPGAGTAGPNSASGTEFDGWGYAHLYDAKTGDELDAYSISEAQDPRFADGSATSRSTSSRPTRRRTWPTAPTTRAACACSASAGHDGLEEVGAWIARRRLELLGRRAVHGRRRRAPDRRLRPRLRPGDHPLHRPRRRRRDACHPGHAAHPGGDACGAKAGRCMNPLAVASGTALGTAFGDQITGTEGADTVDGRRRRLRRRPRGR